MQTTNGTPNVTSCKLEVCSMFGEQYWIVLSDGFRIGIATTYREAICSPTVKVSKTAAQRKALEAWKHSTPEQRKVRGSR